MRKIATRTTSQHGTFIRALHRVWRQKNGQTQGRFAEYEARDIPADASFLEMLDIVNEARTPGRGTHRVRLTIAAKASAACAPW